VKHLVLLIDGYIDDPAALGVPPYISPIARAVAGVAMDAGIPDRFRIAVQEIAHETFRKDG